MSKELEDFLQRRDAVKQSQARILVEAAGGASPDDAAKRLRAAREQGTTPSIGGAIGELQSEVGSALEGVQRSPALQRWLARGTEQAAVARGDFKTLADTSEVLAAPKPRTALGRVEAVMSMTGMPQGSAAIGWVLGAIDKTYRGITSGEVTPETSGQALRAGLGSTVAGAAGLAEASLRTLGFEDAAAFTQQRRQAWERAADLTRPKVQDEGARAVLGGIEALPANGVALVGGAALKSAKIGATLIGAVTGGASYGEAIDAGLSNERALLYGGVDWAIETGTELAPFEALLSKSTAGFGQRLMRTLGAELPGEQIATFGQDLNAFLSLPENKDATWGDFLAARPDAAYQTLVASVIGSTVMTTAVEATNFALDKMGRNVGRAANVEETERFAEALGRLASASKVLQRDKGSFEEFVAEASAESEVSTVFVEAAELSSVLDQSGLTVEEIYEATGILPEELAQMAERGEDVAIPVEQYASSIAPTPLNDALMPHIRLDPDDMSRTQAETFLQSAQQEFEADATAALEIGEQQNERAASRAWVEERILEELNTARRFTSDVNQVYATVVGSFFDTMAQRSGTTAQELAERYGLRVQSGEVAQPTFDQMKPTLNIGMDIPEENGGGQLTTDQVREALAAAGFGIADITELEADDRNERTAVAQLVRPMSDAELDALSVALKQQAIPQLANGKGVMRGPKADLWGPFNPEFFRLPDGSSLAKPKGDGRRFRDFFAGITSGASGAPDQRNARTLFNVDSIADFIAEYQQHMGRFDDHIGASIPAFREVQYAVGAALVKVMPKGGRMLDIAGSEGALAKAIAAERPDAQTIVLDPNPAMRDTFNTISSVPNASFVMEAFTDTAADEGKTLWTEDTGEDIRGYKPDGKFEVVHEAMGFQFIHNDRAAQIARVKEMTAANGIAIFEEKFVPGAGLTQEQWQTNEELKDEFKAQYFSAQDIDAKRKAILEGKGEEQKIVGMNDLMVAPGVLEDVLLDNFQYAVQFWDSGNFKGYVASDSQEALAAFVGALVPTQTEFSTVATPRAVGSETFNQSAAPLQTLPMQVQGTGPGGRVRNWDLGEALTLRHRAQYGRPLDPTDPTEYQVALDALLEDYANQQAQPDNGEAWYSDDIAEALAITTRILPELEDPVRRDIFLTAVALLSPRQGPVDNWSNAIAAMTGYSRTGRFALEHEDGTQFGVKAHSTGLALFQHLIEQEGEIGALVWLSSEHTGAEMEAVRRASGLFRNKADNYLPSETNKTESKLGVYMFGPKVGDFMLNSAGLDQSAVTVDLWMARTYNRIIGRLTDVNEKRAAEGDLADQMRGKAERNVVKQLVRDAAQRAGIAPSAMQAALWYFEQRLYRNHGIQADSTSFSDAAREAALNRGIPVDGVTAQGSQPRGDEAESGDLEEGVRVYFQGDPLDAFKRESYFPSRAVRHADGTVYADIPALYPDRQERLAGVLGAKAVVAVSPKARELDRGVPLWHSRPPLEPDGTLRLDHWGPAGITETDPARWGESGTAPRSERQAISGGLPRTFFGIASGQPGGYIIEFPGRTQYSAFVDPATIYDVAADPDKLKPAATVAELERKIKAAGYIGYWTADPQLGLVATVFEPLPVKPAGAQTLYQDAVFFSALERTLEKTATNKASAQQWKATLEKTPGIKAEELEWTGLLEFLEMQDGAITREQLLEVVRGAGLRVDEVVLGGETEEQIEKEARDLVEGWRRGQDEASTPGHPQYEARLQEARQLLRDPNSDIAKVQFASWSSDPSNETYRELLITLPIGEGRNPNRAPSTHWDTDGVIAHARFMDKTDAGGKRVLFIEEVQSDWHQKGRDSGYEDAVDPEIMQRAATRYAETRARWEAALPPYIKAERELKAALLPLASRALKVNLESSAVGQSRSVQEGLRRQFRVEMLQDPSWNVQTSDYARIIEAVRGTSGAPNSGIDARAVAELNVLLEEMTETEKVYDALSNQVRLADAELQASRNSNGIPNAPFRTDWPALVMKRMIRWAAEHGYERIAWTTGEQQAERYNLSQATGPIGFTRAEEDGKYWLALTNQGAWSTIIQQVGRGPYTPDQLSEVLGRDIAQRGIAAADESGKVVNGIRLGSDRFGPDTGASGAVLEGDDLRVGGEGMKAFYDRNLVNITNKLVKKYGARVGPVSIPPVKGEHGLTEQALRYNLSNAERQLAEEENPPSVAEQLRRTINAYKNDLADFTPLPQPGFDITPELADAAMGGFPLFQRDRGPRGQIAFAPDITATPSVITLLRGADLSTFVHELGHFMFEVTNDMASRAGAPADVIEMRDTMLRYLGVESATEWENRTPAQRRDGHERIARSFEAYLFEGRAPSIELQSLFSRLRSWMLQVYRTITRLNVELTDEVRGAFDRMLAADDAIAEAQADAEMRPLFAEKPPEMSDADWAEYQQMDREATADASAQLSARSMRDMRYAGRSVAREIKRLQKQVAEQRRELREEVEAEVSEQPIYRAISFFRTGELDGEPWEGPHKLNTGLVREALALGGDPIPDALRGMTNPDGLHPEQAAELFGFTSADHLLKDLLFAPSLRDAVDAETDQRMKERYGDLNTPEDVEEAARAAVHNEVRGRFAATELAALQKAPGKKRVLNEAAKRIAQGTIARLRIRDLRPGQYEAAERRAAREAARAGTAKLDDAVRHTRNRLLQFHLAKSAHEAKAEAQKARDYLRKFDVKGTRANIDVDFLDQIDQLLERFDLRQVSNKAADRRRDLADWVEKMRAEGFEPALDPETLRDIGRKPWRELTVEEMRGVVDAVRNIEHLGRVTKKLFLAKDKADLDTAAAEMAQSVRDNAARSIPEIIGSKSWWERVKSGGADFFAMHRKVANMVHVFDGGQYGGVFWERFIRPMNERGDWETSRNAEVNLRLAEVFKLLGKQDTTKREYIPEIDRSLSLEDRLMFALNMGNAANLQRLLDGDRLEYAQLEAIIAPLTAQHWDFVEAVWAEIDSFWPEIAAKERRVTGNVPEKVEAQPFQVEVDGELRLIRGGYFPIKYDPDRSSKAAADDAAEVLKQMTRGLYASAQTRKGHTKERVDEVKGRPLRKSFSVIFSHANQVVHDLAWHEYLIDANRLLRHGAVDAAVREHYGPETLKWMRKALEDIAIGDLQAMDAFDAAVNHIRTGASIAAMGWNLWTSLLQPVGLTQSIARIGVKHVAKGIGNLLSNPAAMNRKISWIYEVSPFMRERGSTMQREINEIRNRIKAKSPVRKAFDKLVPIEVSGVVADSYFVMIAKAQLIADLPTWLGQYEKSLAAGETEDRAVAIADQAVIDSQGGGQIKDLAGIQRGGPLMKLWTNFYSYFSATMNLMADRTAELRRKGAKDLPYYAVDIALLTALPATLSSIMYSVLREGLDPGDDDDREEIVKKLVADNASYLAGTMIGLRETAAVFSGYAGYSGPAGARAFAELARFGKQVEQGEADEALVRSANSLAGILLHYPAGQLDRTVRGIKAVAEGDAGPMAILMGPPPK